MSDVENQVDEICVLQSIYTEEEFCCDKNDDQNCGQFVAYINLPKGFRITYKNFKVEKMMEVPISFLPPIILKFKLPKDYPSKSMPDYEISCVWLSVKKLNLLCKRLDDLWIENKGTVILYTWTQFLKEESLEYLSIGQSLDLTRRYMGELKRFNHYRRKNEDMVAIKNVCSLNQTIAANESPTLPSDNNIKDSDYQIGYPPRYNNMPNSHDDNLLSRKRSYKDRNRSSFARINHERNTEIFKDPRIKFQPLTSMYTHQYVTAYSEDRAKIEFLRNIYFCDICFQDKLGTKCTEFQPCNHVYCKECIKGYFESRIHDGMVQTMPCPYDKCNSEASQNQIKEIIGPNLYEKYDDLLLSATLNMMEDITYCPRQSCGTPVMREADDKMAVCTSCHYVFCVFCKMTYHGVEPCRLKNEEKRKIVEEYEKADNETKFRLEKRYGGKKHLQAMVQLHHSEKWISNNSKACPKCGANIEKSDGCNKMVCWKCKQYFCWLCLKILDPKVPYQHFLDPSSECNNQLFHGVEMDLDDDLEPPADFLEEFGEDDFIDIMIDDEEDDEEELAGFEAPLVHRYFIF